MKWMRAATFLSVAVIMAAGAAVIGCSSSGSDPTGVSSKAIIRDIQDEGLGAPIGQMDEATGDIVLYEDLLPGEYTFKVVDEVTGALLGFIEIEVGQDGSVTIEYEDEDSASEESAEELSEESVDSVSEESVDEPSEESVDEASEESEEEVAEGV